MLLSGHVERVPDNIMLASVRIAAKTLNPHYTAESDTLRRQLCPCPSPKSAAWQRHCKNLKIAESYKVR
ncbi:hypothetical protein TWF132_010132 [Orbilia oligospora]|nr:hypothetical protein TWF132_010132 [Orbilia oligospora]